MKMNERKLKKEISDLVSNKLNFENWAHPQDGRTHIESRLNKLICEKNYEGLRYVLDTGKELISVSESIGYNFFNSPHYFLSQDKEKVEDCVNLTKYLSEKENWIDLKTILEMYSKSEDKYDLMDTISGAKKLSERLGLFLASQYTNLHPTFAELYQNKKMKLGIKDFSKFVQEIENLATEDRDKARKLMGYSF